MKTGKNHIRQLHAAAALLLCVVLSGAMLLSRLADYAAADDRQYIPLTRSTGITSVLEGTLDPEGQVRFQALEPFDPTRPVILAAQPVALADWFRVTDENTVWKGETRVEIFRVSYKNGGGTVTVRSGKGDRVIAPGTENSYTFALENTADGPLDYALSMKAYLSDGEQTLPVEVKVTRDTDKTYLLGSADAWADVQKLNQVSDSGSLKKGYVMPYTLSWQWPFEGDDALDTALGSGKEDLTLTVVIETTAGYAPPDKDGGIPKTGDTSAIGLWFAVMMISGAGIPALLAAARRKEERYERA